MNLHEIELALREMPGPADEAVEALTPHGTYRFDISAVEWDDERRAIVLRLTPLNEPASPQPSPVRGATQ